MTLAVVFGILGNIISAGLFLSPIPTFVRIWKEKSTQSFSWMPYAATLTNCLLWAWYGLPWVSTNIPVLTINASGAALQFGYVAIFLAFAPGSKRTKLISCLIAIIALIITVIAVTLLGIHTTSTKKLFVGILCAVFTTGMNVAPLSIMRMVITTGSVEFMPFYLSFFVFVNGCAWFVYGLLTSDIFVLIPNCLGTALGVAQLVLYAIYSHATPESETKHQQQQQQQLEDRNINSHKPVDIELGRVKSF